MTKGKWIPAKLIDRMKAEHYDSQTGHRFNALGSIADRYKAGKLTAKQVAYWER
jgi:hypothetical protein